MYVRIKSTAPLGSVSGSVTHSGGGAATQNLSVAGTVASNQPSLTLSTTNLTGFSALQGSVSSSKSYTISGVNLTGAITVTAPTNFEISTNNISFVSSLSLTPVGTTLANTVVYARIAASAPLGAASGSISNAGGSAATQTVALSGNVSSGGGSGESWVASSGTNSKGSINTGQSFGNKTGVWINELHYDTTGTDSGEFIEVVVAPDVANALSEISVVLYNGNGGAAYGTLSLTNYTLGSTVNGYRIFYYNYPSNGIQNGGSTTAEPDGIVITVGSAVAEFLSYEGVFTATSGAASGMTSKNIGITETSAAVGSSLQLTGSPSTAVAPSITSTNAVTATNYAAFSYQITASNSPVSYNASGLPNGLSINTSNGLISGTNRTTPGIYTIGLSAINSAGEGTKNLTLTLLKNPGAPTITSATNATAYLRSAFTFTATANPAATAWTFAGLPSGLTNSGATISGTPTTTGTFSVAITATNSLGSDSQSLALTVVDPVISLSTNSIAGLSSTVGKEGSVQAYMVSGSNLTSNITVTAPTHFRISEDGVNFTNNPIPVKLSLQAMRISINPLFFISVKLFNQNLAPSLSLIHNPRISL